MFIPRQLSVITRTTRQEVWDVHSKAAKHHPETNKENRTGGSRMVTKAAKCQPH